MDNEETGVMLIIIGFICMALLGACYLGTWPGIAAIGLILFLIGVVFARD